MVFEKFRILTTGFLWLHFSTRGDSCSTLRDNYIDMQGAEKDFLVQNLLGSWGMCC